LLELFRDFLADLRGDARFLEDLRGDARFFGDARFLADLRGDARFLADLRGDARFLDDFRGEDFLLFRIARRAAIRRATCSLDSPFRDPRRRPRVVGDIRFELACATFD